MLGGVDGRPDLDGAWSIFGHRDRLVEVGHVDDGEAADDVFRLDERAVRDADLAVLPGNRSGGAWASELLAADDLAGLRVLLEPLAGLLVVGHRHLAMSLRKLVRAFHRAAEQQDVLHFKPPPRRRTDTALFDAPSLPPPTVGR